MGRYAQRRRSGGGTSYTPIVMTEAHKITFLIARVDFSGPILAGDFTGSDFVEQPSLGEATGIAQVDANTLELEFDDIESSTAITYQGNVSGIVSPTTQPFT